MLRLIAALFVAAQCTLALADDVPRLDIASVCRQIAKVGGTTTDFDACMRSESDWRTTLAQEWSGFPAADRSSCLSLSHTGGVGGTYSELLTCLELSRNVRQHHGDSESGTVGRGGR